MKAKNLKAATMVCACLGCLAPWLASAQQPIIIIQPKNQFLNAPGTVTFSVGVRGTGLTYQWLFNGTAITGATNVTYTLASPQPAQWGYYSVIVSNVSGSVTSQVAELKIFTAARHSLSGIQAQADGSMGLTFAGETTAAFASYYDLYPLESSSNLVNWVQLATLQRSNIALDTLRFLDTNAPQFSQRFYRTPTNQLATPDPAPTGPYPVGTFSMVMIDSSRTNPAGKTNYQFMTTFWYPAVAQAEVLPAKYVDPQVAALFNWSAYGGGNFSAQVAAFFSLSLSNAPFALGLAPCPAVLFDPGFTGWRTENTAQAEDLASWGYVVVDLDTSDTPVSVFPNGQVVPAQITSPSDADIEGRLLDLRFVLDQLPRLNAGDPRLAGRLDLDHIGAFGHSMGGSTVAQLCLRDSRCRAGANFDGSYSETNLLTQPLSVPWLCLRDAVGGDPNPGFFVSHHPDDMLEVHNEQVTNAYYLKLASTVDDSFCDVDLVVDSATLEATFGSPSSGQFLAPARVSQILRAYLLSFFNKFLKGEDDHLLDGPSPAYPEVMQFLSTSRASVPPEYPSAALVEGSDGKFYGTTAYGGASGKGTVFQVTTNGALTILVSFNGTNGSHPTAALIQGSDGNFYGTTACGGTNGNHGTVFQVTPAGMLTTLVSLNGTNGSWPLAGLVQANDGDFYGTTLVGGAYNSGTVFKMTSGGALTTLVAFNGAYGSLPFAGLLQGTNGSFYGTTSLGGSSGHGVVFRMSPAGVLTMVVDVYSGASALYPAAAAVQGQDGSFYGTTAYGGNYSLNAGSGFGTVFKMTPAGGLNTLVSFNGANGSYCASGLVQGTDGNFYGTTGGGGSGWSVTGGGTVFKMTPTGALTTLVSFNGANGNSPQAALIQGSDGNFYGTTTYGGRYGGGTVFQVTTNGVLTTLVAFGSQPK